MIWTEQDTIETSWGSRTTGVRVITEINNNFLYNQPELDYAGFYVVSATQYRQADDVETAWAES